MLRPRRRPLTRSLGFDPSRPRPMPIGVDAFDSCVMDISSSIYDSYRGFGDDWQSMVDPQYDLTINGTKTFNGNANFKDAFIAFSSGGYAEITSGNTDFLNNIHKNPGGEDFTFAIAFKYMDNGSFQSLIATKATGASIGIQWYINSGNDAPYLAQRGGTSAPTAVFSAGPFSDNTEYLAIVSHSHSSNLSRLWVNSDAAQEQSHTFNGTASDAATAMRVGLTGDSLFPFGDGTEVYDVLIFNQFFDDSNAAALRRFLSDRRGGGKYGL